MDLSEEREEAGQDGDFHVEACLWAGSMAFYKKGNFFPL